MNDGFGIISTEYKSRLNITAQQELRPHIPNPNDKTDADSRCQTNLQGNLKLSKMYSYYIQRGGEAEMGMGKGTGNRELTCPRKTGARHNIRHASCVIRHLLTHNVYI